MKAEEIKDEESLRAWLEALPEGAVQPVASVIAHRAAMRVMPLLTGTDARYETNGELTLAVFRANFSLRLACIRRSREMRAVASVVASAAASAAGSATSAPAPAYAAAIQAAAVAINDEPYPEAIVPEYNDGLRLFSEFVARTAGGFSRSVNHSVDAALVVIPNPIGVGDILWQSVRSDAISIDKALSEASLLLEKKERWKYAELVRNALEALIGCPLWIGDLRGNERYNANMPLWARETFDAFANSELARETSFGLIVDWYRGLLPGGTSKAAASPFDFEREVKLALGFADLLKDLGEDPQGRIKDPVRVMDRVAEVLGWERERTGPDNAAILAAQHGQAGNKWVAQGDRLQTTSVFHERDEAVAKDDRTKRALASLVRKVEGFLATAEQFDELYGWEGFAEDYRRLAEAITAGQGNLVQEIWDIYDRTLTVASYVEQDNERRKFNPAYSNAMLSPDHRRALSDLVRSLAPFVRRFPSIETEDENAANFLSRVSLELAGGLLESAHENRVITDKDRELIQALISAMERNGLPAEKAGVRGYFSVRNLVFAAAVVVTSTVAQGTIQKVELYDKITDWLSDHIEEALEIAQDAPADVRVIIEQMVEVAQQTGTGDEHPIEPADTVVSTRQRRREED